jgi:hypothetical protein
MRFELLYLLQYIGRMTMSVKGHETLQRSVVVPVPATVIPGTRTVMPVDLSLAMPVFAVCVFVATERLPKHI